jgi:hypothetical protein
MSNEAFGLLVAIALAPFVVITYIFYSIWF